MDRSNRLGQGSIPYLLLTFSAPAIVGMLAQALYNVVDRIFVGQAVGPLGIAGTTVAFPFMLIVMAFGMLIGFGATALVSIRLGEQKRDEAERVLGNAVVLLVGVSILLTAIGLALLAPLLTLFGSSEKILPYASDYLRIIVLGTVFQTVGFGLNAVIRGEGNPRIAMVTMLIGALLNTILDPIFLFGFGWGMRGAAAATIIAQAVSALWVLGYFLGGRSLLVLQVKNLRLRWSTCAAILALGSPMFAMQIAASVLNAILNNQLRIHGGDLAISAMGIIYAVVLFIAMPVFGINQGAQPIIGYNFGARNFDRVKRTLLAAVLAATGVTSAGFLVVMLFPSQVVWLFNHEDAALMELGTHAIRICLMMLPIVGFQIVSSSYFQAVGKPKQAMFLSLSRQVLLLIPAVLLLPYFFGLGGVWAAMPTADLGSSVLTGIWLLLELRHLGRPHHEG
ncbi:MAG: MATE family efflux transporter [Planctomycetes bacterium RBG_16_64_12]|nr:MAG: MATE family efflux transporter [Planctomycetes bacterium RBG_16_64_12]